MNSAEENYRNSQADLSELEKSEQALFNETMKLTQEQTEELKAKVAELEKLLEERLGLLDEEEASMKKAEEFVASFDKVLEKTEEDNKKRVEELNQAVNKRYELHSAFTGEYRKLIDLQREVYEMLADEGIELESVQRKVEEVNEQNQTVHSAINSFNESTIAVNGLKNNDFGNTNEE